MRKLFQGNGFLTEEGKNTFQTLQSVLDGLVATVCRDMSESEMLTVQAALAKMVGDTMSNAMQAKRDLKNKFAAMSDEQFEGYLKAKYGDKWRFVSLTTEELDRVPRLTREEIEESLSKGIKAAIEFYNGSPIVRPTKLPIR